MTLRAGHPLLRVARHPATAWIILLVSFAFTGLAWYISDRSVHARAAERFHFQSQDLVDRLSDRMREYEMALHAGAALFNTAGKVGRADWRTFVAELELQKHYPGIQGLGYTVMIPPPRLAAHVAATRAEGFPEYTVRPAGPRDAYSSIVYLEPFDWRNQRAFGYDMYSEPVRRQAMDRARDTGDPAISGRVTLVQETEEDVQHGFLMYHPLYRLGQSTETVEERRAALTGFVYAPFRMRDLMRGILGADEQDIDFELYDGDTAAPERLLYNNNPGGGAQYGRGGGAHRFSSLRRLHLGGQNWTLFLYARPGYISGAEESQPSLIAFGGILVDLLLFVIIGSYARQRQRSDLMSRRTLGLVERERARLSRELHDGIGQSLVALNIALQQVSGGTGKNAMERTREIASQLVVSVRELAHGLRPSQLDDLGLAAALRWHVDKFVRPLGLAASFSENLGELRLAPEFELCCFRVAQEALANALRHASATELRVELRLDGDRLTLSLRDNGIGFDTADFERHPERLHSLGLLGMQERVIALGGVFHVRSAPGEGTEIVLTLKVEST